MRDQADTALESSPSVQSWMSAALDEIDCGVLVVDAQAQLLHANRRAHHQIGPTQALDLQDGAVRARDPVDAHSLGLALRHAQREGRRCLLNLGGAAHPLSVAVVPLGVQPPCSAILLMLGRQSLSDPCSLQWFAHDHGLTPCEQRVLEGLVNGQDPGGIATQLRVGISTVRTHIGALREKTGAPSIRALLHRMAALPPLAPRFPS